MTHFTDRGYMHLTRETFGHTSSSSGLFQGSSILVPIKARPPSANSVKPVSLRYHTYTITVTKSGKE